MTLLFDAIIMITTISGAARKPLSIAAQNSAFTGSMCMKFSERPMRVATVIAE